MKTLELKGQKRDNLGKKGSKDLRKEELIPCVIYNGKEAVHFAAALDELKNFIYTPEVFFAEIEIDGVKRKGVMKEIQFHNVSDDVLHVDFLEVKEDKKVRVSLPVKVTGNSAGVRAGGKLMVNVRTLSVEALPKDLPDNITIDITSLNIGDKFRVSDITVNGVTFLDAANVVIATVKITRNAKAAADAAAAAPAKK